MTPPHSAVSLLEAIRQLSLEERAWLVEQIMQDVAARDFQRAASGAGPATEYGRELLDYLDGMGSEERSVIEELAHLDRTHGQEPTPSQ